MGSGTATMVGSRRRLSRCPNGGRRASAARRGRGAGDRRLLDLQPLPLRARLARPDARRRPRLRGPRRALPRDQLQRRRALPADSLDAMRERVEDEGGWPHPVPPRREPGGGAGLGRREDARTSSSSTPSCGCATEGAPDADYERPGAERRLAARGARRGARGPRARARPRPTPVGCAIKWKQ